MGLEFLPLACFASNPLRREVTRTQVLQRLLEAGAVCLGTTDLLPPDLLTAGLFQRIQCQ